jgi:cobalamin biosynthesis Mg chelatase CobN
MVCGLLRIDLWNFKYSKENSMNQQKDSNQNQSKSQSSQTSQGSQSSQSQTPKSSQSQTQASGGSATGSAGGAVSSDQPQRHPQQNAILDPLIKFENAIAGFAGTLGETRHNIETVVDLTLRSKDELVHIKDAFMPYLTDARDVTQKVANKVRSTPTPVIWTVAGLIGSFLVWTFYSGKAPQISKAKAVLH